MYYFLCFHIWTSSYSWVVYNILHPPGCHNYWWSLYPQFHTHPAPFFSFIIHIDNVHQTQFSKVETLKIPKTPPKKEKEKELRKIHAPNTLFKPLIISFNLNLIFLNLTLNLRRAKIFIQFQLLKTPWQVSLSLSLWYYYV